MSCYSKIFSSSPEFAAIREDVNRNSFPFGVLGLPPAPKALMIHSFCEEFGRKAVVIAPDDASAQKLADDLTVFGSSAAVFPARDFNFQDIKASSSEYEQTRIGALSRFTDGQSDILVCSAEAAMQYTVPPDVLKAKTFSIKPGMTFSTDELREKLVGAGYSFSEMVEGAGQFSVRGGIVDIFPANTSSPVRIELWGDEIDTVSEFDIISQRRTCPLGQTDIPPCGEIIFDSPSELAEKLTALSKSIRGKNTAAVRQWLDRDAELLRAALPPEGRDRYLPLVFPSPATVFSYVGDAFLFVCDSASVKERALSAEKLINEDIKELFTEGKLCKGLDKFTLSTSELFAQYEKHSAVYADNFARGSFDTPVKDLINFKIMQGSRWDGAYTVLVEDISPAIKKKYVTAVFAGTEKAAQSLFDELNDDEIPAILCKAPPEFFTPGYVYVLTETLSAGIDFPAAKFTAVSYGRYVKNSKNIHTAKKRNPNAFNSLEELQKGDYVVHATSGIGIFDGIEKVCMEGVTKDYIKIKYAKGDVLYVPVTKLELVSKYIGPHEDDGHRTVKINRLGSGDWEKTKTKVRSAVRDIAAQLLKLYAARQAMPGYAFSPDIDMQHDFENRFEYEETDDQMRCIHEIKHDMEKPCPMDRLLCGDVGFGKTEVALRAAFKCICDGKQVAMLVPTTILAFQHYNTILHRFDGFPIKAEMLCRFRTPAEQKRIIKELKTGGIDIIAGTHRIISNDVRFKDLGLLIVDEEQRFGVAQKEKLKEKFPNVDVLTISATPIPRTLNFAMMGLRDLSVIEEAPLDRYPIQTYVIEHDAGLISQAIAKELRRGGQVYYLHNRIDDIDDCAAEIQKMFPDAAVGIGHGKMNEQQLGDVWKKLTEGDIDILVCTTIIETGVDVPNCNTLIIEDANRMGLAQLHQLRGRVGRSARRASAYLTYRSNRQLSETAEKRLETIREFTQFGAGFKIAMRDLEIRGAGDMLGAQQHGHMASVGYEMYLDLLTEEVERLKSTDGKPYVPKKDCLVDIQIDAHIPESYISDYSQRIAIYKRIADIHTDADVLDVTDELIDRYGDPPASVEGLIRVAHMKNSAADNGIYEITQRGNCLILFVKFIDRETLSRLAVMRGRVSANASAKPYYSVRLLPKQSPVSCLSEIISLLTKNDKNGNSAPITE